MRGDVINNKNTSYLKECNEEEKGIGCPPELRVQESREEGEDIIFCCAEDQIKQKTRPWVEGASMDMKEREDKVNIG